jgi:hypothetical protein
MRSVLEKQIVRRTNAITSQFVMKLKADRKDKGEDEIDECLAIGKKLRVGGLIVEIDGDRAVLSGRFDGPGHVSSPCG